MGRPVYYVPGSAAAGLLLGLQPPFAPRPWPDASAASEEARGPGILLVDGTLAELARAGELCAARSGLVIVALLGAPAAVPAIVPPGVVGWLPPDPPAALIRSVLTAAAAHAELRDAHQRGQAELARLAHELRELTAIGIALSAERDTDTLLELILTRARAITGSDAGSLYLVEGEGPGRRELRFKLVQNDSVPVPFKESLLPIDSRSVAGHAALTGQAFNLEDAYAPPPGAPFRLDEAFDRLAGYLTKSMLVVPMKTPAGEVLGVFQLINRKADPEGRFGSIDEIRRTALPFSAHAQELACFLASQAAVALQSAHLYAELREALRTVEESQRRVIQGERLRALGEMAGGIAHDFNNVLAVVVGRAQLLLRQTTDPELRRQLEVIEQTAQEGARTVRRVQEFARVRRTRPFQPFDLVRVAHDAVDAARPRWHDEAQARGLTLDVEIAAAPIPALPLVVGDPAELREAILAVLFNALDAMPYGGRVVVSTRLEEPWVCCAVGDTGVGMTETVRQRVFEPFFTTKAEQGTGLGLSIAYGIVTRHGGQIDVQSRPGEGSIVTIRLPAAARVPGRAVEQGRVTGRQARILVMEDEPPVGEILVDLLSGQGHEVVVCPDGRAGIERLGAAPFDLVMIDLGMPGASGWEVAAHVRLVRPEMPIVLVTGWGHQIDPDDARQQGIDYVVAKPFDVDAVSAVVAAALLPAAGSST